MRIAGLLLVSGLLGATSAMAAPTVYEINATFLVQEVDREYQGFCEAGPSAPNCGDLDNSLELGDFLLATYRFQVLDSGAFQAVGGLTLSRYVGAAFQGSDFFPASGFEMIALDNGAGIPGIPEFINPADTLAAGGSFSSLPNQSDEIDIAIGLTGDNDLLPTSAADFDVDAFEAGITTGVFVVDAFEFFESSDPPSLVLEENFGGNLVETDIRAVGVNIGDSPENPLLPVLPVDPEDPVFVFQVPPEDIIAGVPIWIDPEIAEGYEYTVGPIAIASITAPPLALVNDPDGYIITIDGTDYELLPGGTLDLVALGLTDLREFTLTGIDPSLMLDPNDPTVFALALTPLTGSSVPLAVTQTPITTSLAPVPLPSAMLMGLASLGFLGGLRFFRRRLI